MFGSSESEDPSCLAVKLFSKYSNLRNHAVSTTSHGNIELSMLDNRRQLKTFLCLHSAEDDQGRNQTSIQEEATLPYPLSHPPLHSPPFFFPSSPCPHFTLLPFPFPFPPSRLIPCPPPLPFEVGPLNPASGSGGELWAPPAGSGAEPQPKSNLVHFIFKIWQLVATILMILFYFFISKQHRKLKIKKSRGGNCLRLPQCSYAYEDDTVAH